MGYHETRLATVAAAVYFIERIPDTIERLTREHRNFDSRLDEADDSINRRTSEQHSRHGIFEVSQSCEFQASSRVCIDNRLLFKN